MFLFTTNVFLHSIGSLYDVETAFAHLAHFSSHDVEDTFGCLVFCLEVLDAVCPIVGHDGIQVVFFLVKANPVDVHLSLFAIFESRDVVRVEDACESATNGTRLKMTKKSCWK